MLPTERYIWGRQSFISLSLLKDSFYVNRKTGSNLLAVADLLALAAGGLTLVCFFPCFAVGSTVPVQGLHRETDFYVGFLLFICLFVLSWVPKKVLEPRK